MSAQARDPNSTLAYARKLLAARKGHPALRTGGLTLRPDGLAFVREGGGEKIVCAFNLGPVEKNLALPGPARDLGLGTGSARLDGACVILGPRSAFLGLL